MDVIFWLYRRVSELIIDRFGHLKPAERHRRLGLLSIIISLPLITCASSLWLSDAKELGAYLFLLGMPLTLIAMFLTDGIDLANQLWVLAIISIMFVLQWVIWGQLIALAINARTRFYELPVERQNELGKYVVLVLGVGFLLGIGSCCFLTQR